MNFVEAFLLGCVVAFTFIVGAIVLVRAVSAKKRRQNRLVDVPDSWYTKVEGAIEILRPRFGPNAIFRDKGYNPYRNRVTILVYPSSKSSTFETYFVTSSGEIEVEPKTVVADRDKKEVIRLVCEVFGKSLTFQNLQLAPRVTGRPWHEVTRVGDKLFEYQVTEEILQGQETGRSKVKRGYRVNTLTKSVNLRYHLQEFGHSSVSFTEPEQAGEPPALVAGERA